ncbi:hypothetical protein D3C83_126750 [compost metagenome]
MAPDVVLVRGDVEIAADDLPPREGGVTEPGFQLGEEAHLVPELGVELGVGQVTAGGDVEVLHLDPGDGP